MPAEEQKKSMEHGPSDSSSSTASVVVPLTAARGGHGMAFTGDEDLATAIDTPTADGTGLTAKRMMQASRIFAAGLIFAWLIAWPIGSTMVHHQNSGTWALKFGYGAEMGMMALTSTLFILFLGWASAAGLRLEATARYLTRALATASPTANKHPHADTARAQVSSLNSEIDTALKRLAEAESLIRQQVRAINSASSAIETGAVKSTERLERERLALMDITEEMNREAEGFAQKIAERTKMAASEQGAMEKRIDTKEQELSSQLQRLESVSAKSLNRFEKLASTMENRGDEFSTINAEATERQNAIAGQIENNTKRIDLAQSELAAQSARLENLIKDQRRRADKLAKVMAEQTQKISALPAPSAQHSTGAERRKTPWREILSQVDNDANTNAPEINSEKSIAPVADVPKNAQHPLIEIAPSAQSALPDPMDQLINRLHQFSLVLTTQLYGSPGHDQLERFDRGERQIFSRVLTSGNTDDLKTRIKDEVSRNGIFSQRVEEFLSDFDSVLEPLAAEPGGENAIEAYLTSPIGKLYIAVGTSVNHFV